MAEVDGQLLPQRPRPLAQPPPPPAHQRQARALRGGQCSAVAAGVQVEPVYNWLI